MTGRGKKAVREIPSSYHHFKSSLNRIIIWEYEGKTIIIIFIFPFNFFLSFRYLTMKQNVINKIHFRYTNKNWELKAFKWKEEVS